MRNRKQNRTGVRILALVLFCCLFAGFVPAAYASPVGTDEGGENGLFLNKWVEETEDGNFKLVLESYATGSNDKVTTEPLPVDIVLVLDESGSMEDVLVHGCGDENGTDVDVTLEGHLADGVTLDESQMDTVLFVGHKVFSDEVDTDKTYTVVYPANGTTRKIYYCTICEAWFSDTNHTNHNILAEWIPFDNENGTPTESRKDVWTCTVQFYEECGRTGSDVLQEALTTFLSTLYDASNPADGETVNNRVAIAGYGQGASYINTDGSRQEVFPDTGDAVGGIPVDGYKELAESAWCDVCELSEDSIHKWVSDIHAEGSTPTHLGIKAAKLAFDNAPETEDENRAKVMILFMDGAPGANYNNYGPESSLYSDWVTPSITSAKAMKDAGVTIYSVGLFPDANGYDAEDISYDVTADGNGSPADGFFDNANCFLHLVSSNYPDATGVDSENRGSLSEDYEEDKKSYYLGTSDATQLADIFSQISEDVTPGSTTVTLDETAYVMDRITKDFQITYTGDSPNVTAYTMSYDGEDESGNTLWEKDEESISTAADGKLHIAVDGQTAKVTNFDFARNYVHLNEDLEPMGKKLVIEIQIEPANATSGGTKLPTNDGESGIYGEGGTGLIEEFPLPYVDLPTTVTVQKLVEGNDSTEEFSFDAAYIQAGDYENIDSEVANSSNYLHLKEGTSKTDKFTLADGDIYELENVKVGTSLTISEEVAKGWLTPIVITSTVEQPLTPDKEGNYTVTVTPGMVITFTNKTETTEVSGSKTWDDADNQDGKRPDSITVRLYGNGTEVAHKEVTANDGWAWTFEDLPKYANGSEIKYTITEDAVPGYTPSYNGCNITNSYTPGKVSISVTKSWKDENDQDGIRPDSVTVKLLADGEDIGKTLILNKKNGWSDTFTGLDEYVSGKKIVYTIEEVSVTGYKPEIRGNASTCFVITNTHTPETTEVSGSKTWDDADNQDGKRPDSITIRLYADGEQVKIVNVTAENGWKWSFTDLPKYENGEEIHYTITEDEIPGYQSEVDGMNVANHYTPGQINIPVTKNWQDQDDADGIRPDSITVKLYADGKDTGKELVLNQKSNWTGSFDDLNEYADGVKILYTIAEVETEGYDTAISGSAETGFVISNSHTPAKPAAPDTPQTGDTTNLALWIGLLAISGTGLTATLVLGKKKRYYGKHRK